MPVTEEQIEAAFEEQEGPDGPPEAENFTDDQEEGGGQNESGQDEQEAAGAEEDEQAEQEAEGESTEESGEENERGGDNPAHPLLDPDKAKPGDQTSGVAKVPEKFADQDRQHRERLGQVLNALKGASTIAPEVQAYLSGGADRLQNQINAALNDDPEHAVRLMAHQQAMQKKVDDARVRTAQARQLQDQVARTVHESMMGVLPSQERADEIDAMLIEASDGYLTKEDLSAFGRILGVGSAMNGNPVAHKFLHAFSNLVDRLKASETAGKVKAEMKTIPASQNRRQPPRTMRPGAGTKPGAQQKSKFRERVVDAKRKGRTGDDVVQDLLMDLEE